MESPHLLDGNNDQNKNDKYCVLHSGIGREIAVALSAGGATVHAISRTKEDLESLKEEVCKEFTV